jgi:hypothetical protein
MALDLTTFLTNLFSDVSSMVSNVLTTIGAPPKTIDIATTAVDGVGQIAVDATNGTHTPSQTVTAISDLIGKTITSAGGSQKAVDTVSAVGTGVAKIVDDVSIAAKDVLQSVTTAVDHTIQNVINNASPASSSGTQVAQSTPAPAPALLSHDAGSTAADLLAAHPAISHIG